MRLLRGAIAVALLLALLTWLLLRGIDTNAAAYAMMLQAFDDFAIAEASLHRDVLQARTGLLRDYDSLVRALAAMEDSVARLRIHAQTEEIDDGVVNRLAATVSQQDELTERFKSSNALLQNSLSYVGLLSTIGPFGEEAQHAPAAGALAAAILYLTRDTSPDAIKALQERIDRFEAQAPAIEPDAEAARALLGHARLLQELLPAVDETLKALVATPSRQRLEEVRVLFSSHQTAIEGTAYRFRLLLYLVSLLLLIGLVYFGLQLRARALALRLRAAFEHVIAENSTRLISYPASEASSRLKQVLGEFCRAVGADRAYVVLDEDPTRLHVWSQDGGPCPPAWPDQALTASARLASSESDIVTVRDVAALPPGPTKDMLSKVGIRGWACVPLVRPGRVRGIMGFDAYQPTQDRRFPLPVLRLAGDVVANALEREFLDRDRARLRTRLERAQRMQMIGSLASGIAHNFNNIISAILGYAEMVEPLVTRGTKPAQHVDEIRRAAERGRDLIDNILTFGQQRDVRVRPVQVRTLFEEAAALLRASLPSGVELMIEDVPRGLVVSGQPAQLQQVILNLCTNAAQAMPHGGSICVTAEKKDMARHHLMTHGEVASGRYVCLAVIDSGVGFDERTARRLFEPFFTTRVTGNGLGLATVHEIVRDHDGAINVQSEPGRGSRFEVWLPAAAGEGDVIGQEVMPLGHGEAVLIVECERERLLHDEEMLAALGYEPVGFGLPADAIVACRSAPDRFDVILVSNASQLSVGLGLARTLHEAAPRHPIVLATAPAVDVGVETLTEAGISELLRRPLVSTELAAALGRCLRSHGTLQP